MILLLFLFDTSSFHDPLGAKFPMSLYHYSADTTITPAVNHNPSTCKSQKCNVQASRRRNTKRAEIVWRNGMPVYISTQTGHEPKWHNLILQGFCAHPYRWMIAAEAVRRALGPNPTNSQQVNAYKSVHRLRECGFLESRSKGGRTEYRLASACLPRVIGTTAVTQAITPPAAQSTLSPSPQADHDLVQRIDRLERKLDQVTEHVNRLLELWS